ncbi:glycosyltransferase [Plantactinospora sp. B6F1]|uniref:glycosyltransferase n=1 Tax=Plantactinospora sp. B6F1 TaxID=3158971 RepID=UPI00102C26B3
MIIYILECPTPHHTPTLNRLHRTLSEDVRVFYLFGPDKTRGWGDVAIEHQCEVLDNPRAWLALSRMLLAPGLRVVCVFGYRGTARIMAILLARLRRLPLVLRAAANVHLELPRSPARRLAKRWYLRTLLGQPEVWTIGSANAAYWKSFGLHRHHLIPYSLPRLPDGAADAPALRERLGLQGRFVFAFVGRLDPVKGLDDLLTAYDTVRTRTPTGATALVITGQGPLEPEIRRYAQRHDDCHFLGSMPQHKVGSVYAAADVFVLPSTYEQWGWVVNEALGFGTRIIVSDVVGAADDLCTDATGRRCRPGDPASLAEAMLAEFAMGPHRAPRLAPVNIADSMAERLRDLAPLRQPMPTLEKS